MRAAFGMLVLLVTMSVSITAQADCPPVEYELTSGASGKIRLSLLATLWGPEITMNVKCITDRDHTLSPTLNQVSVRRAGQVIGWVRLRGEGDYMLLFRGANKGSLSFDATWPLVVGADGTIDIPMDHPESRLGQRVDESVLNRLAPMGVNTVAFLFRAPLWKNGNQFIPYVEISVTEKTTAAAGISLGPLQVPLEPLGRSFITQLKPYLAVDLTPANPPTVAARPRLLMMQTSAARRTRSSPLP